MATISGEVRDSNGDLAADVVVRAYRRDTGALLAEGLTGDGSEEQVGDPDFDKVALLLHMDGADGSTTFTDSSGTPKTITRYGNARISTDQSKFSGASGYFDGVGDYLSVPATGLTLPGDFTIETWVYLRAATTYVPMLDGRVSAGSLSNTLLGLYPNKIDFVASGFRLTATATVSLDAWHHIAVTRSGSTVRAFTDGQANTATGSTSADLSVAAATISIGKNADGNYLYGYLDDLRITKGLARYTANFTPPTEPFLGGGIPARPLGEYTLTTDYTGEVNVIALDASGDYNDLILRTTPV